MDSELITVKCIGMDEEGRGIVKVNGKEVHVPYLIEGETAIIKNGKLVRIKEKSPHRVTPVCPHFERCGGCHLQHLSVEGQAEFKQKFVENLLSKYQRVNPIITMKNPYSYRNKIHSTLASYKKGTIVSGIYEKNSHNVIPIERCLIQDEKADVIIASIRDIMKAIKIKPYDEDKNYGFLRHILVKTGFATGQIMVVLVVASQIFPGKKAFVQELLKRHPEITTIVLNVNNRKTSVVLGDIEKVLYGKGYIEDALCGCVFQISPKSFYQINPVQTEVLYNIAIKMVGFKGDEVVLDAYCGIGTISLIVSRKVKNVIGVELNKDAVKDAIRNAKRNGITNVFFHNADAGDFMVALAEKKHKIDTVYMDPPRSGSDETFLFSLATLAPHKIIYISCNPITQERDLAYLVKKGYKVDAIQPVDMFPQTTHV